MSSPAHSTSVPEHRTDQILKLLRQDGSVSVDRLSEVLQVSIATVRRDLRDLEKRGLLRRIHGRAIPIEPLFYEPFRMDSSFQEQVHRNAAEKLRIGIAAAELIKEGDTISLTPGTTTIEMIRSIRHRTGITVVTNTVNVAMELSQCKGLNVFVAGGHLRGEWFSLVGPTTIQALSQIFIDKCFIGVNGIDAEAGLTAYSPDEAAANRTLVQNARERIALADHTKLGVVTSSLICPLRDLHMLITDTGATREMVEPFRAKGVNVRRV